MGSRALKGAFSPDGYIISQEATRAVPYGFISSDINGCGWIAAYNFFKATGRAKNYLRISHQLSSTSAFHAQLGTWPGRLKRYIEQHGYALKTTHSLRAAPLLAKRAPAGILFYIHGNEPHFVAFKNTGGGVLRFFNAEDGNPAHFATLPAFIKQHVKLPILYLMVTTHETYRDTNY